jgi:homoserine kinase type II
MKAPTKKQALLISDTYNLGKVKSIKPIKGGWVNYNYLLRTDKGNFVVRILGNKAKKETRKKLANEFKILESLHEKGFPYQIPYPIKNKFGKYPMEKSKKIFWVYPYIKGSQIKEYDDTTLKSIVVALATYHKYIENVKIKNYLRMPSLAKIAKKYRQLKKIKPTGPEDKFMIENIDFFEKSIKRIKKIRFNTKKVPIHYDPHKGNLLFENKKVIGILDFERALYAPRILDIAHLIKCTYQKNKTGFIKRVNFIVEEYNKVNPLTERERELILPTLAKDNCKMFEIFYRDIKNAHRKKIRKGDLSCLKWTIDVQKLVMEAMR